MTFSQGLPRFIHPFRRLNRKCLPMFVAGLILVANGWAQENRPVQELNKVGIDEKLETQVPGSLKFQYHDGTEMTLSSLFADNKAIILTLNYANCPMLCNLQLTGLVNSIKQLEETAGSDFQIVTVSINPEETPEAAADVRARYLKSYGRDNADWKFLVGEQDSITTLANSVGFGYEFLPETEEFAHTAVLILLNPEGKVSRYLYGIEYDPSTLRLSLLETAAGEVRSTFDQLILYCFQYDSTQGRYTPAILKLTRVGGTLTILVLGAFILRMMRRKKAKTVTETTTA